MTPIDPHLALATARANLARHEKAVATTLATYESALRRFLQGQPDTVDFNALLRSYRHALTRRDASCRQVENAKRAIPKPLDTITARRRRPPCSVPFITPPRDER